MARLLQPASHKPVLGFRFEVQCDKAFGGNAKFYAKGAGLPKVSNNPLAIENGNTYINVKTKTRWQPITFSCYMFEGMTVTDLWAYYQLHQDVPSGIDKFADSYKADFRITVKTPDDSPVHIFSLKDAFIAEMDFGDMDWSNEEPVLCSVVIVYDWANKEM